MGGVVWPEAGRSCHQTASSALGVGVVQVCFLEMLRSEAQETHRWAPTVGWSSGCSTWSQWVAFETAFTPERAAPTSRAQGWQMGHPVSWS